VEKFYDESPMIAAGNSGTAAPDCVSPQNVSLSGTGK
jgi:hypothetical protein